MLLGPPVPCHALAAHQGDGGVYIPSRHGGKGAEIADTAVRLLRNGVHGVRAYVGIGPGGGKGGRQRIAVRRIGESAAVFKSACIKHDALPPDGDRAGIGQHAGIGDTQRSASVVIAQRDRSVIVQLPGDLQQSAVPSGHRDRSPVDHRAALIDVEAHFAGDEHLSVRVVGEAAVHIHRADDGKPAGVDHRSLHRERFASADGERAGLYGQRLVPTHVIRPGMQVAPVALARIRHIDTGDAALVQRSRQLGGGGIVQCPDRLRHRRLRRGRRYRRVGASAAVSVVTVRVVPAVRKHLIRAAAAAKLIPERPLRGVGGGLLLAEPVLRAPDDLLHREGRVFRHLLLKRRVLCQLHRHKGRNVLLPQLRHRQAGLLSGPGRAVHRRRDRLPAGDDRPAQLAGGRLRRGHGQRPLQQVDAGEGAVHHLHPARGAADAGDHGGRADVQALVLLHWSGHVEKQLAGHGLQLQLLPGLGHLAPAGRVQLHGLGAVQTDVGIAVRPRLEDVAAVKAHSVGGRHRPPCGGAHRHSPLRLLQPQRGRRSRLRRRRKHQAPHQQQRHP